MKQKIHIFSLFFFLFSLSSTAQQPQPYEWEWAMNGGGIFGGSGLDYKDERIFDIKVGTDGNYYFIATIVGSLKANVDGYPVDMYNTSLGGNDVFLFSTTCDGQVRWSQAIGGGGIFDQAHNLVLDENNNVYVGVTLSHGMSNPAGNFPVHFSDSEYLPDMPPNDSDISEFWKTTFLVKYDSDGNYIDRKALQGDITGHNFFSQVFDLVISDNKLHFMVGLLNGTHLDNQVTVPANYVNDYQYFIARYDFDLNYVSSFLLPIPQGNHFPNTGVIRFAYDENKKQYYIAGIRGGITGGALPLTYNGKAFAERSFILAINDHDGSEVWRREIYSQLTPAGNLPSNCIFSLVVDKDSDVYVGGSFFRQPNENNVKIYDPTDASVQPYFFIPGAHGTVPMIIKFNSDGDVQWAQATEAYAGSGSGVAPRLGTGLAINNDEVVLGAQGGEIFGII